MVLVNMEQNVKKRKQNVYVVEHGLVRKLQANILINFLGLQK